MSPIIIEPIIDNITLTGVDIYNKFVTLSRTPLDPTAVTLTKNSVPMTYGIDYTVGGKILGWEGLAMDTGQPHEAFVWDVLMASYTTEGALNDLVSATRGVPVISTVNTESVIARLNDPYFNDPLKISRIDITYLHSALRETRTIIYVSPEFSVPITWTTYARTGTWLKNQVRVRDTDGAVGIIPRSIIGTLQDLSLT